MPEDLKNKIVSKQAQIGVIGLGYVGLPLAVGFAKKGFLVIGIDTDIDRVEKIKKLIPYILDVSISDMRSVIKKNKLHPTTSFKDISNLDILIICVPTPLKGRSQPNISYIVSAVRQIAKRLRLGQLIILESTTYPGTTEEVILPLLQKSGLKVGRDFYLAFSPERIDPGNKKYDLKKIPKIVGGIDKYSSEAACLLYEQIVPKTIAVSSPRVAEFVKLLENTFRLVNIGLVNELAMMCHKMNVDIWEVIEAAKTKPFGFMPFYPGPGVGGHCIPKDPLYLYWKAKLHGFKSRFIKLASNINSNMPHYLVSRLEDILNKKGIFLEQAKILIMGVTYKKDVKDLRKSPALELIEILGNRKVDLHYHDPYIPFLRINGINLKSANMNKKLLSKMDCVVIVTDHLCVDYDFVIRCSKLIFDTRGVLGKIKDKKIFRL